MAERSEKLREKLERIKVKTVDEIINETYNSSTLNTPKLILDENNDMRVGSQETWIEHANKQKNKCWFPDLGDIIQWTEQAMGNPNKYQNSLDVLRKCFDNSFEYLFTFYHSGLSLSTAIEYNDYDLFGKIFYHKGSKNETTSNNLEIPDYCNSSPISDVLSEAEGLIFMQALIRKEYTAKKIIKLFKFLSQKSEDDILVLTVKAPSEWHGYRYLTRISQRLVPVWLESNSNNYPKKFCISASRSKNRNVNFDGCFRGMRFARADE